LGNGREAFKEVQGGAGARGRAKLVSLVLFGSVARGEARRDSDVDILIVAEGVPRSRLRKQEEFLRVEEGPGDLIERLWGMGYRVDPSPIILDVREARTHRPIHPDMVEDAVILYDRGGLIEGVLREVAERLSKLGAERGWVGRRWSGGRRGSIGAARRLIFEEHNHGKILHIQALERLRHAEEALNNGNYPNVVRQSQETAELLKAALRLVGAEPPKWRDVGPTLSVERGRFPEWSQREAPSMANSRILRREREPAMYGDEETGTPTSCMTGRMPRRPWERPGTWLTT